MKTTFLLTLVVLGGLALSGCALLSPDERDFYGKGWINPRELDDQVPKRPVHPETAGAFGATPLVDPILDE